MSKTIKELIQSGSFFQAKRALDNLSSVADQMDALHNILLDIAYNNENICAYAFICFLLSKTDSPKYHKLASAVLDCGISFLPGAYHASYYHHIKATELEPTNVDLYAELLFFYDVPEQVISQAEAKNIAQNILAVQPNNTRALAILNERTSDSSKKPLNINTTFEELVLNGRISLAKKIATTLPPNELASLICKISLDTQNICLYAFVWSLLQDNELSEYHQLAANILNATFKNINGAKETTNFHTLRAEELIRV